MKKISMRKLTGFLMVGIFSFVMYGGVAKASDGPDVWNTPNSLPNLSGEYELNTDVIMQENTWVIDGKNIIIDLSNHSISFHNKDNNNASYSVGVELLNGASLTIKGVEGASEENAKGIYSNVDTLFHMIGNNNTLDLNNLVAGIDNDFLVAEGKNNININNVN